MGGENSKYCCTRNSDGDKRDVEMVNPDGEMFSLLAEEKLRWEWSLMPQRIILIRHGESEANAAGREQKLAEKGDNKMNLTARGLAQALECGKQLRKLLPANKLQVILSPFERTQQTWMKIAESFDMDQIRAVHVDPRIREKEYGNLQPVLDPAAKKEIIAKKKAVGRFWWRDPDGESFADVYDRVSNAWKDIMSASIDDTWRFEHPELSKAKCVTACRDVDTYLVVTHGLTLRLMLMRYFAWSVDTFETVFNPDNCNFVVLKKRSDTIRGYYMCVEESSPPRPLWSTRKITMKMKSEVEPRKYTVVNWITIPQPRTDRVHWRYVLKLLIPGHHTDPSRDSEANVVPALSEDDVEWINFWVDQGMHHSSEPFTLRQNAPKGVSTGWVEISSASRSQQFTGD